MFRGKQQRELLPFLGGCHARPRHAARSAIPERRRTSIHFVVVQRRTARWIGGVPAVCRGDEVVLHTRDVRWRSARIGGDQAGLWAFGESGRIVRKSRALLRVAVVLVRWRTV